MPLNPNAPRTSLWLRLTLVALALLSALSLLRTLQKTAGPQGGIDSHPYWLGGITLRQGDDPYRAGLLRQEPRLPVRFLDGVVVSTPPLAQPGLIPAPPNTAPLSLLLFQLGWFSWPTAKWIWALCNVALALLAPWLVLRCFPATQDLPGHDRWLVSLGFYAFTSTRVAVWVGQTTLLVFVFMLAAWLLRRRNTLLAGLCLGMALSKYSLALPLFVFLLLQRQRRDWAIAAIALLVQAAGVLGLCAWCGVSPAAVLADYWGAFLWVARATSGPLTFVTGIMETRAWLLAFGVPLALALPALLLLIRAWRRTHWAEPARPMAEYALWTALTLGVLLPTYHGVYDPLVAILFLPLALHALRARSAWELSKREAGAVAIALLLLCGVLISPGSIVGGLLSDAATQRWLQVEALATNLSLCLACATTLWLLWHLHRAGRLPTEVGP